VRRRLRWNQRSEARRQMAIYRLLQNIPLGPEQIGQLTTAYETALRGLGLKDRDDPLPISLRAKFLRSGRPASSILRSWQNRSSQIGHRRPLSWMVGIRRPIAAANSRKISRITLAGAVSISRARPNRIAARIQFFDDDSQAESPDLPSSTRARRSRTLCRIYWNLASSNRRVPDV
jgi:hypothetical protein